MLHRASELAGCCEHGNEPSGSVKGVELYLHSPIRLYGVVLS